MKALGILAAVSLALAPVAARAASDTVNTISRPISGPLAGRALEESKVPVVPIVASSMVLLGGILIGLLSGGRAVAPTAPTAPTINGGTLPASLVVGQVL